MEYAAEDEGSLGVGPRLGGELGGVGVAGMFFSVSRAASVAMMSWKPRRVVSLS